MKDPKARGLQYIAEGLPLMRASQRRKLSPREIREQETAIHCQRAKRAAATLRRSLVWMSNNLQAMDRCPTYRALVLARETEGCVQSILAAYGED